MNIGVMDAQGAGLGQSVIKRLRHEIGDLVYIIALGTNNAATANMLKAGADLGITGEEDICLFCRKNTIDALIGPVGIMCSGGINGEITASISMAVFEMECIKYIIPLRKHGIYIPGTRELQIKDIINEIVQDIKKTI
ncbi:DUF3842 family protein [Xylanivirga thermophila]|uniref:DUF3842 family protein n=1 Tax=Xylanivirga thermophila TaxID=2496273 RepID=UPI00101C6E5E|nr:DUF3842 family protein [Xylanivirga thermophila]